MPEGSLKGSQFQLVDDSWGDNGAWWSGNGLCFVGAEDGACFNQNGTADIGVQDAIAIDKKTMMVWQKAAK